MCVAMRRAAGGGSVISTLDGVVFLEYNSRQDPPGVYRPEGEDDGAVSSFHSTPEAHMTNLDTPKCGCCFIISLDVLRELAQGKKVESADRATYQRAYAMTQRLRLVREGHRLASLTGHQSGLGLRATAVAKQPVEHLFDCKHATTLPGSAVPDPTTDQAFKTVFDTTAKVAEFYKTVLGRQLDRQPGHGPGVEPELTTRITRTPSGTVSRWSTATATTRSSSTSGGHPTSSATNSRTA